MSAVAASAEPTGGSMRVAALYDIHGNLPALESVLAEIRDEAVDRIVVGGDVVPGPMPVESISVLRDLPLPVDFIYGNGERDVLAVQAGEPLTRVPAQFHEAMRWVAEELPAAELQNMASWPATLTLDIQGLGNVLFCHATPRSDNELFTRVTPAERLAPILEPTGAAVVVCGHTHMQFDRMVGNVRVVNAGSIGMPFGTPGAHWALLGPGVELRRTSYDLGSAVERISATAYPQPDTLQLVTPPAEQSMVEAFEAAALNG